MSNGAETLILQDTRTNKSPWRKWGPYLSERQWGTVREDYSQDGNAWDYFSHDQARSRAYHWGEDGLAGISDDKQLLCFSVALWNGKDDLIRQERRLVEVLRSLFILLLLAALVPSLHAQTDNDFDSYKLRIDGFWFYSNPTGSFQDATTGDIINLKRDFGFNSYSTFTGKIDWKFTRKNHLYVAGAPFNQSRTAVLQRTIVFQGQTFNVGLVTNANLNAPLIAPGYQYDIIRRKRGHFGLAVQFDLFNSTASLFAAAQVNSNNQVISAKKSLLAPIPVAGPQFRFYLTDSPRLYVEGNVYGMYFFGYGNFVSTTDYIGVTLTAHLSANAGYQLGSRLNVNVDSKNDRLGLSLTQKGPIVGVEVSF